MEERGQILQGVKSITLIKNGNIDFEGKNKKEKQALAETFF